MELIVKLACPGPDIPDICAGAGHRLSAVRALGEAADRSRVTSEPQRQFSNAFFCPVSLVCQRVLDLRILRVALLIVVICNRHGFAAAVDDGFLGIRRGGFIAHCSAVSLAGEVILGARRSIAEPIVPCVPYLIPGVVVVLEVVDGKEITGRKAPDFAGPWTVGTVVGLIDAPVVS